MQDIISHLSPLSAQIAKGHALPIGTGKITIFDGVASSAQIEEAK